MAKAESKPTAVPTHREFIVKDGNKGVFSHKHESVAMQEFARLHAADAHQGVERKLSVVERTVTHDPLSEDHPQYDAKDPLKFATGEESRSVTGVSVKERKVA